MSKRIGNPDSKYAYTNNNQLDIDIAATNYERIQFIDSIKQMVIDDPSKIDLRYHDLIVALCELKKEYNL